MADKISKLDAARRQIETAIELYFGGGDALPVYTLAYAAFKVLFDLYPHKSDDGFNKQLDGLIKAEGWKSMAAPANFLKHADRDPDALLDEQHPDRGLALIGLATVLYRRLAGDLTRKMMAFDCWVEWLDEEALTIPEVDRNAERAAASRAEAARVSALPHQEKIAVGKQMYDLFVANFDRLIADKERAERDGRTVTDILDDYAAAAQNGISSSKS